MDLAKISGVTQDIAEAIKAAFEIDVEIVDRRINRVAATGFARNLVGQKMLYGTASTEVIAKGQPIVIQSMKHAICQVCPGRGKCTYIGGIITPIFYQGTVIGTINMVAYDQEKMDTINKARHGIINFSEKMSSLIESKLIEEEYLKQKLKFVEELKVIANTNPYGVLITDEVGFIKYGNKLAFSMLDEKELDLTGKNLFDLFFDLPKELYYSHHEYDENEIVIKTKANDKTILVEYKRIIQDGNLLGVIFSFKSYLSESENQRNLDNQRIKINDIKGQSAVMQELKLNAMKFAQTDSTILLTGENGTGKDLFAEAIHHESLRSNGPFVIINCGALPENLIESELFGYEKGAFTGADNLGKKGKFELANKGTLFLDEIGTMPVHLQTRLLRVIQNREIVRIGGSESKKLDVRIIAATNENLFDLVEQGKFRKDLYYRLHVIPLHLPPLRDRKDDLPILADGFIKKFNKLLSKSAVYLVDEAKELLMSHNWPGNIRELENVVEYAMNSIPANTENIGVNHLPPYLQQFHLTNPSNIPNAHQNIVKVNLNNYEEEIIKYLLEMYGVTTSGKQLVAQKMKISPATLYRKIKKYNL